jgi:hypothetical protein
MYNFDFVAREKTKFIFKVLNATACSQCRYYMATPGSSGSYLKALKTWYSTTTDIRSFREASGLF